MKLSNNKYYQILIFLLIVIAILYLSLAGCRETITKLSGHAFPGEVTGYPENLIEGLILNINLEEPVTLTIEADVFRIVPGAGKMEKNIRLIGDSRLITYNMVTEEEKEMELNELRIGDYVTVTTLESTREYVTELKTFNALRVGKAIEQAEALLSE